MTELTPQEQEVLVRLRQRNQVRLGIAASARKPISHPEKYAHPLGIDSDGELFPDNPPPPPAPGASPPAVTGKIDETDLVAVRVYITQFHGVIDRALREKDWDALKEYDAHIRLATYGLYQLPAYRDAVYRGAMLPDALTQKYVAGSIIQEPAFISTSAHPARQFPGNVQYVIQSFNGRLVRALADDPEELEVVLFTQSRFKVLAVEEGAAKGERTVFLAEIPDPRLIRGPQ